MLIDPNQFPITQQYTYLNSARFCALYKPSMEAQKEFIDHLGKDGSWAFDTWTKKYEETRVLASSFIGGAANNTFFLPNVSTGYNLCAQYLPKRKVICLTNDFPTVNMVWEPHGFEVILLDHRAEDFEQNLLDLLDEDELIISVSWIQSADGFEIDLDRIYQKCIAHNHWLVLDATQGIGAVPFTFHPEVKMVLFASGFKWTLAGYGIAIGYIAEELQPYFEPMRGWFSIASAGGGLKTGAMSLEVGNACYINVFSLFESLKLIQGIGVDRIQTYNEQLVIDLEQTTGRQVLFPHSRSSVRSFDGTPEDYDRLVKNKIQATLQKGRIRISPNFYNSPSDIERLVSVLKR